MALDPVSAILNIGDTLIKRVWPDPAQQAEAQRKLMELAQTGELQELATRAGIVQAEAQSEHILTATWRPITMLTFVVIIANNYILYPYLSLFFVEAPRLDIPPDMWKLLSIGLGGYVVGRTAEKVTENWKGGK